MDDRARQARRQRARRRAQGRRRLAALAVLALSSLVAGFAVGRGDNGGGSGDQAASGTDRDTPAAAAKPPPPPAELPRGGRKLFPEYRVVGFFGAPQDAALGALGIGTPAQMARRLRKAARPYRHGGRPIMPAFELIAVVASGSPGNDGNYSYPQDPKVIDTYLAAARREKALLVLDIQPGRADFVDEAKRLRPYLEQPDVALALDPEWRVGDGQIPGKVIGSVSAREVNRVTSYVARIVRRKDLPQKLVLIHQFTDEMIPDKDSLRRPKELALTINVDGFGKPDVKRSKYVELTSSSPGFHHGFKLFYEEDTDLMSPPDVLALRPRPSVIVYE